MVYRRKGAFRRAFYRRRPGRAIVRRKVYRAKRRLNRRPIIRKKFVRKVRFNGRHKFWNRRFKSNIKGRGVKYTSKLKAISPVTMYNSYGWGKTDKNTRKVSQFVINDVYTLNLINECKNIFGDNHIALSKEYKYCRITKVQCFFTDFRIEGQKVYTTEDDEALNQLMFDSLNGGRNLEAKTLDLSKYRFVPLSIQGSAPIMSSFIDNRERDWDGGLPPNPLSGFYGLEDNCTRRVFKRGMKYKVSWYPRMKAFPSSDYNYLNSGSGWSVFVKQFPECTPVNHPVVFSFQPGETIEPVSYVPNYSYNTYAKIESCSFIKHVYIHLEYSGREPNLHDR